MAGGVQIGTAFIQVTADTNGAFNGVGNAASRAGDDAGGFFKSSFMKGLAGMGAAIGGAFAIDKIGTFVTTAVNGASDLNEEASKSQAIFGSSSKGIADWAKGAVTSVGLSEAAALKVTGTFGNMFTQIGFGGEDAAALSKEVVGLSADLGSFNNLPTAEVADMMGAAFRGEYDSISALLPGINAANVEQKALEQTGKKSAKTLTEQEKATAVLALANEGGAKAAGDFAKTQGGFAGQSKIAAAELENMSASIGSVLLPVAVGLMSFVNTDLLPGLKNIGSFITTDVVPAFQNFANGLTQAMPTIGVIAGVITTILLPALIRSAVQAAITAATNVAGWVSMGIGATVNAAKVVAAWVLMGIQSMLNAARMAAAWLIAMGPIGIVIALVVGLVALIIANWDTIKTFTIQVFQNVAKFLSTVWINITTWIGQAVNNIRNTISTVFNAVKSFITTVFNNIKSFITTVWNGIKTGITTAVNGIKSTVSNVFNAVKSTVSNIFNGVKSTITTIWGNIKSTIQTSVNGIKSAVEGTFNKLAGIMEGAFNGVSGTIKGVINGVIGAINGAIGGINTMIGVANKVPGVSIPTMGTIPMLATGGTLKRGGAAIVGEEGPELVTLPTGATVHPNGSAFTAVGGSSPSNSKAAVSRQTVNNTYHITIDAKNVKDFNSVVDIMSNINQTARTGRGVQSARVG